MSGSVSLLARSALEVKAKGLATPVGVPSGQRRSPYHGGVCHRELMCSPGVARRRVTRMAGVKLNNGNTGTNNMVPSTVHCCVFSHSGRSKSRQFGRGHCHRTPVSHRMWPGRLVVVTVTIACGKERSIGPMLGSWKSGQVEFGVVIVVDVKDTVNSQNPQVSQ